MTSVMKNCLGYKGLAISSQSIIYGVTEMTFLGSLGYIFLVVRVLANVLPLC